MLCKIKMKCVQHTIFPIIIITFANNEDEIRATHECELLLLQLLQSK